MTCESGEICRVCAVLFEFSVNNGCPVIWTDGAITTESLDLHEFFNVDNSGGKEGRHRNSSQPRFRTFRTFRAQLGCRFQGRAMFDNSLEEFVGWHGESRHFCSDTAGHVGREQDRH